MMTDFVTLLGVKGGPALRPRSNLPTSILMHIGGTNILVDAGIGVSKSICDQGIPLTDIDTIFITHLHSDHYLELGPLIHTAWVAGRHDPITIYGPSRLQHYWDTFLLSMEDDIQLRIEDEGRVDIARLVTCHSLEDKAPVTFNDITIHAMINDHPPIRESFALRFEWQDRIVVLSGDTAFMTEMIDFAKGADLLIHEAMLVEGVDMILARMPLADDRLKKHILRSHTSAEDVGRIAQQAGVKRLVLNHFVPDGFAEFGDDEWITATRKTWQGDLTISRDGMKIII